MNLLQETEFLKKTKLITQLSKDNPFVKIELKFIPKKEALKEKKQCFKVTF